MTSVTTSIQGITPIPLAGKPIDQREKLKEASQQFEAIFLRQILAEARKNNFDKDGLFDSQGASTFRQMLDDKFADNAAKTGTFGLAKLIEAQLARTLPQETK